MRCTNHQGFALLFVLAIISILGLSLSTLFIQNKILKLRANREIAEKQAENGALFALNMAIARLQKFAGPDNAISVHAGNICPTNATLNPNARHTVAILATDKQHNQYSYQFQCWLNSNYNSHVFDNIFTLDTSENIVLLNDSQDKVTIAPREMIFHNDNQKVKWCFFIEDESQKIDLSLVNNNTTSTTQQFSRICAQLPNIQAVTTFSHYKPNLQTYQYLDFLEQFALIDNNLGQQVTNSPFLCTLHSYGVLSKQRGLKTEINNFLNAHQFSNNDTIFQSNSECIIQPPTWQFLQSFINQLANVKNNSIKVTPTIPFRHPQYLRTLSPNFSYNDTLPPIQHGFSPVVTQMLFQINAATDNGKLILKIYPQFVLWNPYSISLQHTNYQLVTNISTRNTEDNICIKIIGKYKNTALGTSQQMIPVCRDTSNNSLRKFLSVNFATSFQPGEVKRFPTNTNNDMFATPSLSSGYDNCLIIQTDIQPEEFSSIDVMLTDQNGNQNSNWNLFAVQLLSNDQILQEISQISQTENLPSLRATLDTSNHEQVLFSFTSYLKTIEGMSDRDTTGVRWLAFANPRAPCINRTYFQQPVSKFFAKNFIPGNWSWAATYHLKTASMINIFQANFLQNAILFDLSSVQNGIANLTTLRHVNWTPCGYLPAHPFANSNANPYIPLNTTFTSQQSTNNTSTIDALYDYSYLLNEALFDNFFCDNNFHNSIANQRVRHISQFDKPSAENTLIKGAFNIHTNTPEPWIAYLSAIHDHDNNILFPRMDNQENTKFPCQKFTPNDIQIFVQKIVNLIQKRHYFATLSAFINRPLNSSEATCGLLQEAINESKLNRNVQKTIVQFHKNTTWFNDTAASGYLEDGLPHVVDQADVLQTIAHFITPRGDTFKITAYAESTVHAQTVAKKCEAIVQRVPEFVNTADNAPCDEDLSPINQAFGRRFKIILFR